ncbi:hypothetical protein ABOM_003830 [Aspergillus bombycis]|uniref:Lysine-specific metallo-endopeptidase domain-containing protein n=1 Tax=Aspergillus bombycis TaxID=109264 RepID=A0A1F8A6D3_9EURO|nr:hypothetical protein ABOM_003830 [Aspergillus bombycis]OGM47330.1 hypothetical protein ABOM_003830 [Aspergillus bombycis]
MAVLHSFLSPVLLLAAWANTWPFALAQARGPRDIKNMFQVSFNPDVAGNCAGRENDFSQIIEDAYILSKAGIRAVSDSMDKDSKTRSEADRLVRAIFQDPSDEERGKITRRFKFVRNFFQEESTILHGASKNKPYLFCSDSWRIREDMSSQMKDAEGNLMKDEKGSPYLIKDDKRMKSRQKAAMRELGASKAKYVFPYWCDGLKAYMFDKAFGNDPTQGPCSSGEKILGYTVWESKVGIGAVVLCNEAFVGGRLRSVKVDPFDDSVFAKGNKPPLKKTAIKTVSPMATTFYHELFHLLFATAMDPENGEEYQFKRMTGKEARVGTKGTQETFSKEQAIQNPHSYVYTSIAYDYTQNEKYTGKDSNDSGKDKTYPIEFYTGWATYNA